MAGVVRLGDICTGHGCFPPRKSTSASNNVKINGIGAVRLGDSWAVHCCVSCHSSVSSAGSSTVKVNGKPLVRKGDAIACGSKANTCSSNVTAG